MAISQRAGHPQSMLTEAYIEAILVDEVLAELARCSVVYDIVADHSKSLIRVNALTWLVTQVSPAKAGRILL